MWGLKINEYHCDQGHHGHDHQLLLASQTDRQCGTVCPTTEYILHTKYSSPSSALPQAGPCRYPYLHATASELEPQRVILLPHDISLCLGTFSVITTGKCCWCIQARHDVRHSASMRQSHMRKNWPAPNVTSVKGETLVYLLISRKYIGQKSTLNDIWGGNEPLANCRKLFYCFKKLVTRDQEQK